jgi:hypothetical protein
MGGCNEAWISVSHGDVLEFYDVDRRARVSDMVIWRARQNRQAQLRRKGQGPPLWKIGIVIELLRSGVTLAWTHAKNVYDLWDSAGYLRAKSVPGLWSAIPRCAGNFCNKTSWTTAGNSNRCWGLCTFWQIIRAHPTRRGPVISRILSPGNSTDARNCTKNRNDELSVIWLQSAKSLARISSLPWLFTAQCVRLIIL